MIQRITMTGSSRVLASPSLTPPTKQKDVVETHQPAGLVEATEYSCSSRTAHVDESSSNKSYIQEACEAAKELHRREFPSSFHRGGEGRQGSSDEKEDDDVIGSSSSDEEDLTALKDPTGMPIPTFHMREIRKNKCLGEGAFGSVYEVSGFVTSSWNVCTTSQPYEETPSFRSIPNKFQDLFPSKHSVEEDEVAKGNFESRRFIADHCYRKGGDARYAIKILSSETIANKDQLTQGIADMATEARMLSSIEHPNIVKLRATASGTVFRPDYFLILDRLYDTLQGKCKKWYLQERKYKIRSGSIFHSAKKLDEKIDALYEERVHAAFDLSAALSYLHSKRILHRDIKPQNIGFDIRGDIKIFDFGFSKQLPPDDVADKDENGLYRHMTGFCGSPRYMAPEVALKQNYNEKCDVYSFSLIFWEMMALNRAFSSITMDALMEEVWNSDVSRRPKINDLWVLNIKLLLRRSWSHNIDERPSMEQIKGMLRHECIRCRDGDDTGLEHMKRRSTFVFRRNRSERSTGSRTRTATRGLTRAAPGGLSPAIQSKPKKGGLMKGIKPVRKVWRSSSV